MTRMPEPLPDRLFRSTLGMVDILTVYLGERLGLYRALADAGPLTGPALATAAGADPRYVREWLEQQTVSGLLEVDDADAAPDDRRYSLPAEHAEVLLDRDSLSYSTPLVRLMVATALQVPALAQAYRDGGGVPWERYGPDMREGQADGNRPWFLGPLPREWLPSVPGLADRLAAGGRVADVGCGEGWSAIGIALAHPGCRVDGFDLDEASVVAARDHAESAGVADRVAFHLGDAAEVADGDGYALVTALECVHDLAAPVPVLATMRALAAPDGEVLVLDERTTDRFTGEGDEVEQLLYGWSTLICLPDSLSHAGSVGTGTVMRPDTLREYAVEAGFAGIDEVPIAHDTLRLYRLLTA